MCGRFTLTAEQEALAVALGVPGLLAAHRHPRFNIAPTQMAPVIVSGTPGEPGPAAPGEGGDRGAPPGGAAGAGEGGRAATGPAPGASQRHVPGLVARPMRWGLVPAWSPDPSGGSRLINARSETVARKPSFRDAFRARRCLVPADGFYEWSTGRWEPPPRAGATPPATEPDAAEGFSPPHPRTPWFIHLPGRSPFTLAGLWERWLPPEGGPPLETFALLTTDAVGGIERLHARMPVLVPAFLREAWVLEDDGASATTHLLARVLEGARTEGAALQAHPVGNRVGSPAHDDPELLDPVDPLPPTPAQGSLFD